jgi:hypothetical protein
MTGSSDTDDPWRPACGACGSTSLRPRVATKSGVEPAVHFYECTACGRAWDGSEAPEPTHAVELLPVLCLGEMNAAGPPPLKPTPNGHDE